MGIRVRIRLNVIQVEVGMNYYKRTVNFDPPRKGYSWYNILLDSTIDLKQVNNWCRTVLPVSAWTYIPDRTISVQGEELLTLFILRWS